MLLNSRVTLRPANPADWPAIEALLESNNLPTVGAREHLGTYLVAEAAGAVVGCAGAEIYGSDALLRSVAVKPGSYRQGIGRLMVEQILREASRRGIRRLHLLSVTAPEYFAQYGFKRGAIEGAPPALKASAEFQGACPACAAFMSLTLHEDSVDTDLPVAVIGAGPIGLAAAARLLERGIAPLIFEAGHTVGANLLDYGHVRLFSPWRYNLDNAMTAMLAPTGWQAPSLDALPLAGEVVEQVLKPFAALPVVARALHLGSKVVSITREGFDKVKTSGRDSAAFVLRVIHDGAVSEFRARAVIDASGTWRTPNPVGASGLPALGEREQAASIFYGIPDVLGAARTRYSGKHTLVVGAGHSAANTLLALAELARDAPGTRFTWAVRTPELKRVFSGGATDALPARGALGTALAALRDSDRLQFVSGLRITEIRRDGGTLTVLGIDAARTPRVVEGIDEIVCATGQRPDLGITAELRLSLDPWLESTAALGTLIDPNLHSCGTVRPHGHRELAHPEAGFYTVGVKSYGRAPTYLMITGYEQVRSVVAAVAGDLAAANRVELELPETGVCSVDLDAAAGSSCCGPAPTEASREAISPAVTADPRPPVTVQLATSRAAATPCCGPRAPSTAVDREDMPAKCCG